MKNKLQRFSYISYSFKPSWEEKGHIIYYLFIIFILFIVDLKKITTKIEKYYKFFIKVNKIQSNMIAKKLI